MIELTHIATGALAGRQCSGPLQAFVAGVVSHALMDVAPHGELDDVAFETTSSFVGIGALAAAHGARSPLVWGAIGGVLPDVEHVLPRAVRPSRELFPTHRYKWLHSGGPLEVPAWVQVLFGGAVIGGLAVAGIEARRRARLERERRDQRRLMGILRRITEART